MIKLAASFYFPLFAQFHKGFSQKIVVLCFFPIYNFFALAVLLLFYLLIQAVEKYYEMMMIIMHLKTNINFETMAKFMAYFSFWATLSLTSSGMIAIISAGILIIVAVVLINIPIFLFIYCSFKMTRNRHDEDITNKEETHETKQAEENHE